MTDSSNNHTSDSHGIICPECRHYFVTWNKNFPHGCRAMGFKARSSPASTVLSASGMKCFFFDRKVKEKQT